LQDLEEEGERGKRRCSRRKVEEEKQSRENAGSDTR